MELSFPWGAAPSKALDAAMARASAKPMPPLRGDRINLDGVLPANFKRLSMSNADRFRIEVAEHGYIFGLMEIDGHSMGGYGGSCIPVSALVALLNLWTSQQADASPPGLPIPVQGELF